MITATPFGSIAHTYHTDEARTRVESGEKPHPPAVIPLQFGAEYLKRMFWIDSSGNLKDAYTAS